MKELEKHRNTQAAEKYTHTKLIHDSVQKHKLTEYHHNQQQKNQKQFQRLIVTLHCHIWSLDTPCCNCVGG